MSKCHQHCECAQELEKQLNLKIQEVILLRASLKVIKDFISDAERDQRNVNEFLADVRKANPFCFKCSYGTKIPILGDKAEKSDEDGPPSPILGSRCKKSRRALHLDLDETFYLPKQKGPQGDSSRNIERNLKSLKSESCEEDSHSQQINSQSLESLHSLLVENEDAAERMYASAKTSPFIVHEIKKFASFEPLFKSTEVDNSEILEDVNSCVDMFASESSHYH